MASSRDVLINILTKGDASGSKQVSTSLDNLAASATRAGQTLSLAVTAPLVALGGLSVKFAADAAESASKLEAVFGPATARVNQKIADLRDTIPATTAELQDLFSGIQDLLVPLGMAPAEAEQMSGSIVELAGDLASFNNIPVFEALAKIRSGLVGQYEPLLSFGVALNATTVKAKAFEQGVGDGKRELTAAERAQVSYQLILEGTTAAHGNAADTAESAANQFKFLQKETTELMTVIGERLLPAVTSGVSAMRDLISVASALPGPVVDVGLAIAGIAAATGPALIVSGSLIKNFRLLQSVAPGTANAIAKGGAIAAAAMAGYSIGTLIDEWTGFSDKVAQAFDALDSGNHSLAAVLESNREAMADQVMEIQNAADAELARTAIISERGAYVTQLNAARRSGDAETIAQLESQIDKYDFMLGALDGVLARAKDRGGEEKAIEQSIEGQTALMLEQLGLTEEQFDKRGKTSQEYSRELDLLEAKVALAKAEAGTDDAAIEKAQKNVDTIEDEIAVLREKQKLEAAHIDGDTAEILAKAKIQLERELEAAKKKTKAVEETPPNIPPDPRLETAKELTAEAERAAKMKEFGATRSETQISIGGKKEEVFFNEGRKLGTEDQINDRNARFGGDPFASRFDQPAPTAPAPPSPPTPPTSSSAPQGQPSAAQPTDLSPVTEALAAVNLDLSPLLTAIETMAKGLQQQISDLDSQIQQLAN